MHIDNRNLFYKYTNKYFVNKLLFQNKNNGLIVIIYDYSDDYFDIKDNKIRIGIDNLNNNRFCQILNEKKIFMIDLRMSMRYIDINKLMKILKFLVKYLDKNGYILGNVISSKNINSQLVDKDIIDKRDEIWIPNIYDLDYNNQLTINIVNNNNLNDTQIAFDFNELNIKLSKLLLKIKYIIPLSDYVNPKSKINFIGEYIIIITRI